jgi:hypothetical protein
MRPHHLSVVFMLSIAGCMNNHDEERFSENLILQDGLARPVINEILFDPLQDAKDRLPDQPDFVEIYNPGTKPVDLTGWSIGDRPNSKTGKFNRYYFALRGGSNILGPGQYGVIAPETGGIVAISRLVQFYIYLNELPEAKILLDKSHKIFDLNNDGDCVRLLDGNGAVIDSVNYTPVWHNPADTSTKRISLEKFNPLMPSDSPMSWSSSTDPVYGGTPGKVNSIYVPPSRNGEMFLLSPNPFSPDGDLRNDILKITISLPAGSYQLAVTVYDSFGGKVRSLANGTPAGPVTLIPWDGRNDAGKLLPAGTYRIAMNAAGYSGNRYNAAETVVLAR